ncbi:putative Fe(2+)-trafficking protein [Candidatus Arsenophonus lipoptenae]|uniref:Putative Fe(2+)-trafficking protein n=1 Tax=Candidatus Arsenophonus lipoptenae TaxID=634113 RepID=A0A0X9W2K9_9GAMM|nr:oxidative damage protection protein [Candidatus Arsenophonus lipoptenae]AMA64744.1 putative Fe(2+)-trafficking protein [Candidatus Arsenophonus lipoptenae]
MNRTIFCTFLQLEAEGLDVPVYPGKIGKRIYDNISKKAWKQWINKQIILINEQKLSTLLDKDKKILEQEMVKFLFK